MKYQTLLHFPNKTPVFFCVWINTSIRHMNPDFATSRWGQWKGCRCHGRGRNLKMVHIPCCVSLTTVTCLRERTKAREKERDVSTEIDFLQLWTITTHDKQERHIWTKSIAIPFDHFPPSWVLKQARSRHLCLWASFLSPIVWRNSRWGCRSVTLKSGYLTHSFFLVFSFLSTSLCGLNIYGLVKST